MYWMVFLLIFLGITVAFVILKRYTQNKTLWITDMSATIWLSVRPEQYELVRTLAEEYNQTLPKSTGVVLACVNFESEDDLIERLEDSFYSFSSMQMPDMVFLSKESLKKLYKRKLVVSGDNGDENFHIFSMIASVDMMYTNLKRIDSLKKYTEKSEEIQNLADDILENLEGISDASNVYAQIQVEENLIKADGASSFITINSLERFFVTTYMQLGGDCKAAELNYDTFYKVWRYIVKGLLLDYISVVPEKKQFFNKIDTVKSPVAVGCYSKKNYSVTEYPQFKDAVRNVVSVTKYGFSFVNKKMNDTKKSVMTYFCEWMYQQQKNVSMALSFGCLPIINEEISCDDELFKNSLSVFAMDIDIETEELERMRKLNEIVSDAYMKADEVIDFNTIDDERVDKIISKIVDYTDACRHKLDSGIDYKDPDNDIVGTMYSRKAFDNWVNYFDI